MKDIEQTIFLKLKKREQHILSSINKSEKPTPVPIILNNIGEMVYKHDPHAPEQSKLNLVIEDYLMESVEHLPPAAPFVIELHFKELNDGDSLLAEQIIRNNFTRVTKGILLQKKREMMRWRFNLAIGFVFLAVCIVLSQLCRMAVKDNEVMRVLQESFSIIGWVALWEPVSYFLYGWREDTGPLNAAIRLRNADVTPVL